MYIYMGCMLSDNIMAFLSFSLKKLTMHTVYYLILGKEKFMINMVQWAFI